MSRRILVTAALPYANGPIHIGHLVEYVQTDVWVRFQKLRGHECRYFCADDTHGTAIMISAKKAGVTEEEFIAKISEEHQRDFASFDVEFDHYGSTNSDENRELCHRIWKSLRDAGLVVEKDVEQLFDPVEGIFLADRFVKGTCPKCGAEEQYGDSCDKCGATYSASDLVDPTSNFSGATPELRTHEHLFVRIEDLHEWLDEWVTGGEHLQPEVANYLKGHFLNDELRDWDVSRAAPYFGFEIPDSPGNYWFVWFDAPIGYAASTWAWCKANGDELDNWWAADSDAEIHHFIGKDIQYFHCLFWPAMLKTAGWKTPTKVHIHGFLNVNGKKMSKRDGTFVRAETYAKHLDPSYLRYFFASKLGPKVTDIDIDLEEFVTKVNTDLVGKVVNLASRSAKFVETLSDTYPDDGGLFENAGAKGDVIADLYEACDYNGAMREVLALADAANKYVEDNAPWTLRKDESKRDELRDICTVALNLFRQIAIYLAPVLPRLAEQTGRLLNDPIGPGDWAKSKQPLLVTPVAKFEHMLTRVDPKQVQAMIDESKEESQADAPTSAPTTESSAWNDSSEPLEAEPLADECTIDDFVKVDLRVARVVEANHVEGADKLLQLTLSLGGDVRKNVFAGIKAAYDPADLVGRLVVCVANLKPRQMKFGLSEGMVCASGPGKSEVFLLSADEGAKPGQRVH